MSREARTLLILGAVALLGVMGLMFTAQRYTSIAARQTERNQIVSNRVGTVTGPAETPPGGADHELAVVEALTVVDTFIEIRQALRAALADVSGERQDEAGEKLIVARDEALKRTGMKPMEYISVRAVYRRWRAGDSAGSATLHAAFERRREALQAVELGAFETLDL